MSVDPTTSTCRVIIMGVGAVERGDDGIGPHIARHLSEAPDQRAQVVEMRGEAMELMDAWADADGVVIVDAMQTGVAPGTIRRCDASTQSLPAEMAAASTHDLGVPDAIELSRAMGSLPAKVIVLAVEGESFAHGPELSPALRARIPEIAAAARAEAEHLMKELRVDA